MVVLNKFVLQKLVLEAEVGLLSLAPRSFVVKVYVCSLLVVIRDRLWLFMTLEPCQVLLVEPPRLFLQLSCSQIPNQLRKRDVLAKARIMASLFSRIVFRTDPKLIDNLLLVCSLLVVKDKE